jgi:hypothetical protein
MQWFQKLSTFAVVLISTLAVLAHSALAQQPPPPGASEQSAPGQPDAPEGEPEASLVVWSFDAQLRPRAELRTNHDFGLTSAQLNYPGIYAPPGDTLATITQRSRLGAGVATGDVSAYLQMQHAAEWGVFGGNALTDPALFLHQGWLKYAPSDAWYVQAGRQQLAYGDHRVLGTVGWTQVGRAWDALRFGISPSDSFGVDLFAGRYAAGIVEFGRDVSLFDRDAWLTGAYVKLREVVEPAFDEVDVYALYDVQVDDLSDDTPNNRNLFGLGARAAGQWGMIDGVIEGMYELGSVCVTAPDTFDCTDETVDVSAWFVDAEIGAEVYQPAGVRVFAAYSRASGDDPETADTNEGYFQFYPTAHKWLGLMDIIGGRSNIQEIRGGASFKAGPIGIRETIHYFSRLEPEAEAVGLEFDTVASVALAENLALGLGHGLFVPSDGMSSDGDPDGVANWGFVQMNATF